MATQETFTVSKYDLSTLTNNGLLRKSALERIFDSAPHWIGYRLTSMLRLEYLTIDKDGNILEYEYEKDIHKLYLASITLKMGMAIALCAYADTLIEIPNQAGKIERPGQDPSKLRKLVENIGSQIEVKWDGFPFILPEYSYAYGKSR